MTYALQKRDPLWAGCPFTFVQTNPRPKTGLPVPLIERQVFSFFAKTLQQMHRESLLVSTCVDLQARTYQNFLDLWEARRRRKNWNAFLGEMGMCIDLLELVDIIEGSCVHQPLSRWFSMNLFLTLLSFLSHMKSTNH